MSQYIISLEDLPENEIQRVLDAIFLLRGIKKIEKMEDDFSADLSHDLKTETPSPNFVSPQGIPPQSPNFVSPQNISPQSSNFVSPQNISPQNQPFTAQERAARESSAQQDISPEQANSQRKIISEALRWGIHNKKITIEEIRNVSPQETVVIAQKIIENMPDNERKRLLAY